MTLNLHIPVRSDILKPTLTVVGVGGAGGNAVNNMIASSLEGVNFVVANTDAQALDHALTDRTIQLGSGVTKGLGAGANPDVGRMAAEEAQDELIEAIEGSHMVFITAGMGGGTGTGAAPVVARLARDQGILTVGVVTKPFQFEGSHRMKLAEAGLKELQEYVDTLIIIPNQNLFRIANERTTFADAFKLADEVLHSGVRGVTDLMVKSGLINLDFADIRTVMREMGKAMMGTGEATGDRRAIEAAEAAISNPLLDDVSLKGARALLINITGGPDMTLFEVDEAANRIRQEVDPDANIIFGSAFNDDMEGRMRVSVVATGIDQQVNTQTPQRGAEARGSEVKRPFPYNTASRSEPVARDGVKAARSFEPKPEVVRANASASDIPASVTRSAPLEPKAPPVMAADPRMEAPRAPVQQEEAQPQAAEPVAPVQMQAPQPVVDRVPEPVQATPPLRRERTEPAQRREARESVQVSDEGVVRGLFQRIADVSRSIATRADTMREAPQAEQRPLQVKERPRPEVTIRKTPVMAEDDQYLDIPAFLRRQAN